MFRRRLTGSLLALCLLGAAGCSSDGEVVTSKTSTSDSSKDSTPKDSTSKDSDSNVQAGGALSALRDGTISCEDGIRAEISIGGTPFATMAADGEQTYVEMSGGSVIAIFMAMFGELAAGFDESGTTEDAGQDPSMPTAEEIEAMSRDLTQVVHVAGDVVYAGLVEDGELAFYEIPKDEFDGGDMEVDLADTDEICNSTFAEMAEIEPDQVYVDPDDDNVLIAPGSEALSSGEPLAELSDDEIRELRDSESRTVITFDDGKLVKVDTLDGLTMEMTFTYGDPKLERPSDAKKVSGEEFAAISEAHNEALDAKYDLGLSGGSFGDESFDDSLFDNEEFGADGDVTTETTTG